MMIKSILLISLMLFSCEAKVNHVYISGKLKDIMQKGDTRAKFDIAQLEGVSDVYGIGAVEDLKGEIIIYQSQLFRSYIDQGNVKTSDNINLQATLLAYAIIPNWTTYEKTDTLTAENISDYIFNLRNNNSDSSPFFFRIEGNKGSFDWHIIDTPLGKGKQSHVDHKNAGYRSHSKDPNFKIIGTFSKHHRHILSHGSTDVHIHAIIDGNAVHVDEFKIIGPYSIYIPEQK